MNNLNAPTQATAAVGAAFAPFPTTRWTMVAQAGLGRDDGDRDALGRLLHRYLPGLRLYLVVNFRLPQDRADDLLQGFIADKILERRMLDRADRSVGRFRTFLATTLERYVLDRFRNDGAAKRLPAGGIAPLAAADAMPGGLTAAELFDIEWARQVVRLTIERVDAECRAGGRNDVWAVFDGRVLKPALEGAEPKSVPHLSEHLGVDPARVSSLLGTAKRTFARHLRAVVEEYAEPGADTEGELAEIRRTLATASSATYARSATGPRI